MLHTGIVKNVVYVAPGLSSQCTVRGGRAFPSRLTVDVEGVSSRADDRFEPAPLDPSPPSETFLPRRAYAVGR